VSADASPSQLVAPPEVIYLVGTSGYPNFGDEIIAAGWIRYLAKARPDAEVWLDCPEPGTASHLFDGMHPRLRTTNTLWRLVHETAHLEAADADAHVDRVVRHLGSPRFDLGLLVARRATSVHLIGGGYLNGMWPHQLRLLRAALGLQEVGGARLFATGLGLTPVGNIPELRDALGAFDHASVRDAESAAASGAVQRPDDGFLALDLVPDVTSGGPADAEDDEVWICLQSDTLDDGAFETAVSAVRSALENELSGRPVRYVEAIPGADRAAYDHLADLIPPECFVPFLVLWEQGFPARAGQTWLTSRFHFHLLAAARGAAGTALEVSRSYYRTKHQSLLEAGTGWSVTPTGSRQISPPSHSPEFRGAAERAARLKLQEAETLYGRPGSAGHGFRSA
jgi:hypothetical protein